MSLQGAKTAGRQKRPGLTMTTESQGMRVLTLQEYQGTKSIKRLSLS